MLEFLPTSSCTLILVASIKEKGSFMSIYLLIASFVALIFLGSCNTTNRKSSNQVDSLQQFVIPVEFIDDASLKRPEQLTDLSDSDLANVIDAMDDFYLNKSIDTASGCSEELSSIKYHANDSEAHIKARYDLGSCLQTESMNQAMSVEIKAANLDIAVLHRCSTGGLSIINGLTPNQLVGSNPFPCKSGVYEKLSASASTLQSAYTNDSGLTFTLIQSKKSELATKDRRPCQQTIGKNGILTISKDCQLVVSSISTSTADSKATTIFHAVFTFDEVEADTRAPQLRPFYDRGRIHFQINDWKGTMTYRGPTQAPTWAASKKGVKKVGTFGERKKNFGLMSL